MTPARSGPSNALLRAFGGSSPSRSGGSAADYETDRVSAYAMATRKIPETIFAASPQFVSHGLAAALDQSAIGAKVSGFFWGIKMSTLMLGAATAVATITQRRRVRRGALEVVIGLLHAKLHAPSAALPEMITTLAAKTGAASPA